MVKDNMFRDNIVWQFIKEWISNQDEPIRLVDYTNMLWPQYEKDFKSISKSTREWLRKEAQKRFDEYKDTDHVSSEFMNHLKTIIDGVVPFGYTVEG